MYLSMKFSCNCNWNVSIAIAIAMLVAFYGIFCNCNCNVISFLWHFVAIAIAMLVLQLQHIFSKKNQQMTPNALAIHAVAFRLLCHTAIKIPAWILWEKTLKKLSPATSLEPGSLAPRLMPLPLCQLASHAHTYKNSCISKVDFNCNVAFYGILLQLQL